MARAYEAQRESLGEFYIVRLSVSDRLIRTLLKCTAAAPVRAVSLLKSPIEVPRVIKWRAGFAPRDLRGAKSRR